MHSGTCFGILSKYNKTPKQRGIHVLSCGRGKNGNKNKFRVELFLALFFCK